MATHNFTATSTDEMAASDSDTLAVTSTASTAQRIVRRSFLESRINWGSAVDETPRGPSFSDDDPGLDFVQGRTSPPDDITVSMIFQVLIPVRFTGCRVYKAPNAVAASVPFTLWQCSDLVVTQASTGTVLATATTGPWVVDDGGWQQVTFSAPVELVPGVSYMLGYYSADGIYAFTPWVWHAQDTCTWPLVNKFLRETTVAGRFDGTANSSWYATAPDGGIVFPRFHVASNYYIDPQIEWEDPLPAYTGGIGYWGQWTTPYSRHDFPICIFYSDPQYVEEYYDMGVNTLQVGPLAFDANAQAYIDAMAATGTGHSMDWWPHMFPRLLTSTFNPMEQIVQIINEDSNLADQVMGYHLWDEPDLVIGEWRTPATFRIWTNEMRLRDSTRPIMFGFGRMAPRNQGFWGQPPGATMIELNQYWRQWADCTDIIDCDDYSWFDNNNASGNLGVWPYAQQVKRLDEICDGTKPIYCTIETTSQVPGAPTPDNVVKSIWAMLIAGARGIILFDHRFANSYVSQDFAAMLHDPPMKAAVSTLCARLQTLGQALLAPDAGLVTAYTSSNKTSGPMGGTFGVPLHYTSRIVTAGTDEYCFVQAIRPGATTGTITIPSWAGETVTVIDESRTEVVSGAGVITDTFAADYDYHLYHRT